MARGEKSGNPANKATRLARAKSGRELTASGNADTPRKRDAGPADVADEGNRREAAAKNPKSRPGDANTRERGGSGKAASSKGAIMEGASGRTTATRKARSDTAMSAGEPIAQKSDQAKRAPVPRSGTAGGVKHPGSGNKRPPRLKPTDTAPTETTPRAGPGNAPRARGRKANAG